jgi:hypothetical protein
VGTTAVLAFFAVGAALLGFWSVARFPSFGPQTVPMALVGAAVAFGLQSPLRGLVTSVAVSRGVPAALLLVVLPSLRLLFWASGCVVRSLVGLITPHIR